MGTQPYGFELDHVDTGSRARRGRFCTSRGDVETPGFMPVGTQGTVKGLLIEQVRETGAQMLLANTYHLSLRPGEQVVARLGGLHQFMGWDGPLLTDSGGFQLFSLAQMTRVTEEGAVFRSHIDGRQISLTPERAIEIQEALGSDVAMVLDHVVALPNDREMVRDAAERTVRWAARCRQAARRSDQTQFAIVQGGLDADLRMRCARQLVDMDFTGYAIGGLSVGEPPDQMYRIIDVTCPVLPTDRPRYLMGVGRPQDLLEAIARGIDLFDCVIPTRNGRNALAFTDDGPLRLRNLKHERDPRPLEQDCPCPACRHSRGYLRHLFQAGEMLGPILLTLHNLTYYQRLVVQAREAISADRYRSFMAEKMARWGPSLSGSDNANAPDQDAGHGSE
jgi:queuine tRNA-ribosyltransferase